MSPSFDLSRLSLKQAGSPHPFATCCWCHQPLVPLCGGKYWRCQTLTCFERQMQYWVTKQDEQSDNLLDIWFLPTPIQVELFDAVLSGQYGHILCDGPKYSSKSFGMRWLAHWLCLKYPGFQVLLLRRTLPELERTHIKEAKLEAEWLGADYTSKYEFKYPNESQITFGHVAEVTDSNKYLSVAYDLVCLDELWTFVETQILDLTTAARPHRRTPPGWRPSVVACTNPGGGSGGAYCRSHFVYKNPDPALYPRYHAADYHRIFVPIESNPYPGVAEYMEKLEQLSEVKYRQWRLGDWDALEGTFFAEWSADHTITVPTKIAPTIEYFCSMKWGYGAGINKSVGVLYWWACLQDGKFIITDEYTFNDTLIKDVAAEYHRRNELRKISVRWVIANPLVFRKGGENIAETFLRHDVFLIKGNDDRENGWMRMRALLAKDADGVPFLRAVKENCPYLCRTVPILTEDPLRPDDIAPKQEDAAADALRLGAMSRPFPTPGTVLDIPREALRGKAGGLRYL